MTPEELLERAIRSYTTAEPRAGLEARVLRRVAAESARRWTWWLWAIPVAACALALVVLQRNAPVAAPVYMVAAPAPPAMALERTVAAVREVRKTRALPKREVFPSPARLTAEERAWMALAATASFSQTETGVETRTGPPEPIQIQEITIKPLQSDGGQPGANHV